MHASFSSQQATWGMVEEQVRRRVLIEILEQSTEFIMESWMGHAKTSREPGREKKGVKSFMFHSKRIIFLSTMIISYLFLSI